MRKKLFTTPAHMETVNVLNAQKGKTMSKARKIIETLVGHRVDLRDDTAIELSEKLADYALNQLEEDMLGILGGDEIVECDAVVSGIPQAAKDSIRDELRKAIKDYFEGEE